MTRTEILNALIRKRGYASYLEIGVRQAAGNFVHVACTGGGAAIACGRTGTTNPVGNHDSTHRLQMIALTFVTPEAVCIEV
jgi:hypothetical protein